MLNFKNGFSILTLFTATLLLIPLVAMQFTQEVNWTMSDFVVMGILCFGLGSAYIVLARKTPQRRILLALLFAALFIYTWAELAVGVLIL
ncbi:hypothetical protein [Paraglaciecola aestuariivivens]